MNYHNITTEDMLNGSGLRTVLWLSHCEHKCKNCQNPQTWDKDSGIPFDEGAKKELFEKLSKNYISGITLSGGDPLSTINRFEIIPLLKEIKQKFPNKNIWCYTGYLWEDVKNLEAIQYIDVLVDGEFKEELSIPSPDWCGSSNQTVIDVRKSLKQDKVIEFDWR